MANVPLREKVPVCIFCHLHYRKKLSRKTRYYTCIWDRELQSGKCMQITVNGEVIVRPLNRLGILSFLYIVFLCVYRRQRAKLVCQNVCVYGCVCTLNFKNASSFNKWANQRRADFLKKVVDS